ncbi:MAG TPA: acyltransferase family protein [Xanthomonadaceae bacterium]|nr:acyltransferase family protein [Xanthomonadaceae bacterium]
MNPTITPRRHDIDALRVLAFALLILYHVGMFYVAGWDWHVKSSYQAESLQPLMLLVNQWRMPLIFLVSGVAAGCLLARTPGATFARQRSRRLLVPLLFGMLVVVPPQAYYEALARGAIEPGYLGFLWRYFTFQKWPAGAFAGSEIGITYNHLWYLPYLLLYSLALLPLSRWLDGRGAAWLAWSHGLRGSRLVLLPVVPLLLWGVSLFPLFGGVSHRLIDDWYAHAMFFTFFAYGYLLARDSGIWTEIARLRWLALALALCSFTVFLFLREILPDQRSVAQELAMLGTIFINRWLWLLAVLGWSYTLLNRPWRWLPYANQAIYPWYVLHQTVIVVAGVHLARLELGPVLEPALVVLATLAGCFLLHHFVIRPSRLLGPLFGLKPRMPSRKAAIEQDASAVRVAGGM